MDVFELSTKEVGELAKRLVAAKLETPGVSVEIPKGNTNLVIAKPRIGSYKFTIRVKSRRSGNWQIQITEGIPPDITVDEREFWVLVDFYPSTPDYYIMPGNWLRRKIYEDHQNYLRLHGGIRPITPKSTHHKVILEDIQRWKDRWEILGLS